MGLGRGNDAAERATRVAVLGNCTTQYYAAVLRGMGAAAGFPVHTFEPEYNTMHQTLLDEQSGLHTFEPDVVVFLTAVQGLRDILLASGLTDRIQAADREADQLDRADPEGRPDPGRDRRGERVRYPLRARMGQLQRACRRLTCERRPARERAPARPGSRGGERVHSRLRPHRGLAREAGVVRRADLVLQQELLPPGGAAARRRPGARHRPRGQGRKHQVRRPRPRQHALGRRGGR